MPVGPAAARGLAPTHQTPGALALSALSILPGRADLRIASSIMRSAAARSADVSPGWARPGGTPDGADGAETVFVSLDGGPFARV